MQKIATASRFGEIRLDGTQENPFWSLGVLGAFVVQYGDSMNELDDRREIDERV